MNFGKYKGDSISEIWDYDGQYIRQCFENINGFYDRLDEEDKLFLYKLTYPISYLTKKYGELHFIDDNNFKNILKKEEFVSYYNSGRENMGESIGYSVEGIYGYHYGGVSPMSDHSVSFDMRKYIMEYLSKGSENMFKKYIKENK